MQAQLGLLGPLALKVILELPDLKDLRGLPDFRVPLGQPELLGPLGRRGQLVVPG